jgi:hypothetical protein
MMTDLEKQIVLLANRLIRVRQVKKKRSIFWVLRFPTFSFFDSIQRWYALKPSVNVSTLRTTVRFRRASIEAK